MKCSIDGCENSRCKRDWCSKHYWRWRVHGDLNHQKKSLLERLEEKVELIPFSTCHWFTGGIVKGGYGHIGSNGRNLKVHRVAYELYVEEIPEGMLVCHTCDNPCCVNPCHLFVGTYQDNMDDKTFKGRGNAPKGEKQGSAKLTQLQVRDIRKLVCRFSQKQLTKIFCVSKSTISNILARKSWRLV